MSTVTAQGGEQELLAKAQDFFEQKDYVGAMPLYGQLVSLNPTNAVYNFKYGTCLIHGEEDKEKAVSFLQFATKAGSIPNAAWYFYGKALHLNYRFSEALTAYGKYQEKASKKEILELPVAADLKAAQNGLGLLSELKDISVLDKVEASQKEFFRYFDLSEIGGKILVTPEELLTNLDKKKGANSLVHYPEHSDAVFYSSYGKDASTGRDIYRSYIMPDGNFSEPQKVAGYVNTDQDEEYAFMHPDGKNLYFCSKGHNSMGGYDVFKSTYDEKSDVFGPAQNLDFAINTPDDDIFYIVDSIYDLAYFASSRSSETGRIHVYKIKNERSPLNLALIQGTFLSEITPQNKKATISVEDALTREKIGEYHTDPKDGSYVIVLPHGGKYRMIIEAEESTKTHVGVVDIPKKNQVHGFRQETSLVTHNDQEKLVIRNLFDEPVDGDMLALAMAEIKRRAALDVNFVPGQEAEVAEEKAVADASLDAGFSGDLSNADIVNMAFEDASAIEREGQAIQDRADVAFTMASEKAATAKELVAEADLKVKMSETTEDPAEKEILVKEAAKARAASVKMNQGAKVALELAASLETTRAAKAEEAAVAMVYARELESAINSDSYEEAFEKLSEQKAKLEETSGPNAQKLDVYEAARQKAVEKQDEADKAMASANSVRDEESDLRTRMTRSRTQLEGATSNAKKEEFQAELDGYEADLVIVQQDIERAFIKAEEVQEEADLLNAQAQLYYSLSRGEEMEELAEAVVLSDQEKAQIRSDIASNDEQIGSMEIDELIVDGTAVESDGEGGPDVRTEAMDSEVAERENESTASMENRDTELNDRIATQTADGGAVEGVAAIATETLDDGSDEVNKSVSAADMGSDNESQEAEGTATNAEEELAAAESLEEEANTESTEEKLEAAESLDDNAGLNTESSESDLAEEAIDDATSEANGIEPLVVGPDNVAEPISYPIKDAQAKQKANTDWIAILDADIAQFQSDAAAESNEDAKQELQRQADELRDLREQKQLENNEIEGLLAADGIDPLTGARSTPMLDADLVATLAPDHEAEWNKVAQADLSEAEMLRAWAALDREIVAKAQDGITENIGMIGQTEDDEAVMADILGLRSLEKRMRSEAMELERRADRISTELMATSTAATVQTAAVQETEAVDDGTASTRGYVQRSEHQDIYSSSIDFRSAEAATADQRNAEDMAKVDALGVEIADLEATLEDIQDPSLQATTERRIHKLKDDHLIFSTNLGQRSEYQNRLEFTHNEDSLKALLARVNTELTVEEFDPTMSFIHTQDDRSLTKFQEAKELRKRADREMDAVEKDRMLREAFSMEAWAMVDMDRAITATNYVLSPAYQPGVEVSYSEMETALFGGELATTEAADSGTEDSAEQTLSAAEDTTANADATLAEGVIESSEEALETDTTELAEDITAYEVEYDGIPSEETANEADSNSGELAQDDGTEEALSDIALVVSEGPDTEVSPANVEPATTEDVQANEAQLTEQEGQELNEEAEDVVLETGTEAQGEQRTAEVEEETTTDTSLTDNNLPEETESASTEGEEHGATSMQEGGIVREGNEVRIGSGLVITESEPTSTEVAPDAFVAASTAAQKEQQRAAELQQEVDDMFALADAKIDSSYSSPWKVRNRLKAEAAELYTQAEVKQEQATAVSVNAEKMAREATEMAELETVAEETSPDLSEGLRTHYGLTETQIGTVGKDPVKRTYFEHTIAAKSATVEMQDLQKSSANYRQQAEQKELEAQALLQNAEAAEEDTTKERMASEAARSLEEAIVLNEFADSLDNEIQRRDVAIMLSTRKAEELLAEMDEASVAAIRALEEGSSTLADASSAEEELPNTTLEDLSKPVEEEGPSSNTAGQDSETAAERLPEATDTFSAPVRRKIPKTLVADIFTTTSNEQYSASNPIPINPEMPEGLVYKVQVGAFRNDIDQSLYEGFSPIMGEKLNSGVTRYTAGLFTSYSSAGLAKEIIQDKGYSDAFIVAFIDGERVSITEANAAQTMQPLAQTTNTAEESTSESVEEVQTENVQVNSTDSQTEEEGNNTASENTNTEESEVPSFDGLEIDDNTTGSTDLGNVEMDITAEDALMLRDYPSTSEELLNNFTPATDAADYYNTPGAAEATQVETIRGLFYTVQVGVYSKPVPASAIYNIDPLNSQKLDSGLIRYTTGRFTAIDAARIKKDEIVLVGVGDAFITAYINGKRIPMKEAAALVKKFGPSIFTTQ